jgi:hypothetical protein
MAMIHMANDSGLFHDDPGEDRLPLYEAKMIHQFDHRWATYEADGKDSRDCTDAKKQQPGYSPRPRYWVGRREVLARIAEVPRGVAKAWLAGDPTALLEEISHWLAGHLMNTVGLTGVNRELERISPLLARAARDSKKWTRAATVATETPLTDAMLEELVGTRAEEDLARLASEWMERRSPRWLMGWRDICRSTDGRTVIASVVPRVGVGHTMPLMLVSVGTRSRHAALLGNLGAMTLHHVARQKVGGTHLTHGFLKQFPVLPPDRYAEADLAFIAPRVLELTYTAHDLKPWAEDLGHTGPPLPWEPVRRAVLRAELDAWYARAYGLTRDELRYILDPRDVMGDDYPSETFRVLKNNEMREFGEYRTRRLVLEAWDNLAGTDRSGA